MFPRNIGEISRTSFQAFSWHFLGYSSHFSRQFLDVSETNLLQCLAGSRMKRMNHPRSAAFILDLGCFFAILQYCCYNFIISCYTFLFFATFCYVLLCFSSCGEPYTVYYQIPRFDRCWRFAPLVLVLIVVLVLLLVHGPVQVHDISGKSSWNVRLYSC